MGGRREGQREEGGREERGREGGEREERGGREGRREEGEKDGGAQGTVQYNCSHSQCSAHKHSVAYYLKHIDKPME